MLRVLLYPQEQRAFIPISACQLELAEGVEFPEKNAGSGVFEPSLGGGGPPVGSGTPIGGDFEPCLFATLPHPLK